MSTLKRRRTYKQSKRPLKRRRVPVAGGAMVTQSRIFVPRSFGNPMAVSETKYFDAQNTGNAIQSVAAAGWDSTEQDPATLLCLFAPTQGNDFNNREGRKVWIKAIKIRGMVEWPAVANLTAGIPANQVRLILVMDKQTNGAQLNGEDVIESGTKASEPCIQEFQNPKFFGRFRVMWDRTYTRPNSGTSYDGTNIEANGCHQKFKINKKFKKPLLVHFNATNGGTVADIVDNSFHFLAGRYATAASATLYYKSRVSFCE